jgi:hypothetical protein
VRRGRSREATARERADLMRLLQASLFPDRGGTTPAEVPSVTRHLVPVGG